MRNGISVRQKKNLPFKAAQFDAAVLRDLSDESVSPAACRDTCVLDRIVDVTVGRGLDGLPHTQTHQLIGVDTTGPTLDLI